MSNVEFINVSSSNVRLDVKLVEEKDGKIQVYYGQSHNNNQIATSTFKNIEEKIKELKNHQQTPIPEIIRTPSQSQNIALVKLKLRASQTGLDPNSILFKTFSSLVAAKTIKETVWLSKYAYEIYGSFPRDGTKMEIKGILQDCIEGSNTTF